MLKSGSHLGTDDSDNCFIKAGREGTWWKFQLTRDKPIQKHPVVYLNHIVRPYSQEKKQGKIYWSIK